ncbi:MAG: sugar diacid recognition domain-containing protein [Pasteurellaceae bacterium]|nr:sugar diacid recognition domain-containing protein [Pasteurellaceae bacterium]
MKLNKSLAQQIVKRTMQIIPNSVNVMDENGVIIASGDPSRLNQRHTGAVVALRHHQITEIDEQLAKLWNYEAREGINLPLDYLGSTVGVIGISGKPDEVRQYAQLVKMSAELIMEQSFQLEQQSWQRRYKEEFLRSLLKGKLTEEQITEQVVFFNLELRSSYSVILIKLLDPNAEQLQTLLAYFEHHYPKDLTAVVGLDRLVLVKHLSEERLEHQQDLVDFMALKIQAKLSIGLSVNTLSQIHISYQTACYALDYAEKSYRKKRLIHFSECRLPALLQDFIHSWQGKELLAPIQKLIEQDHKNTLRKTLHQYFLSNCDLVHTSDKLSIHTNTLRYRLDKIEQITSLSFNKIEDKFVLYLATIQI